MLLSPAFLGVAALDAALLTAIAARTLAARRFRSRGLRRPAADRSEDRLPLVLQTLSGGSGRAVVDALLTVGRHPAACAGAIVLVAEQVREQSGRAQFVASWACCRVLCAQWTLVPALQRDASPLVRVIVARAIGRLGAGATAERSALLVSALVPLMADPDVAVRRAASRAAQPFAQAPGVREALVASLVDLDEEIRHAAAEAIGSWPDPDPSEMSRALESIDEPTARVLLAGWSRPPRRTIETAIAAALDPAAPHRLAAIRLLGVCRLPRVQLALAALIEDSDRRVRDEAVRAAAWLARLTFPEPLDRALTDRLLAFVDDSPDSNMVASALEALAHSADGRIPAALIGRIPGSAASIRERLVEAAALFGQLEQWSGSRAPAAPA